MVELLEGARSKPLDLVRANGHSYCVGALIAEAKLSWKTADRPLLLPHLHSPRTTLRMTAG